MDGILASYDEGQLALLLDYFARVQPVMAAETARLRRQSSATGEGDFAAPLGAFGHARLEFAAGAARVTIRAEEAMTDLCRAHFEGPAPRGSRCKTASSASDRPGSPRSRGDRERPSWC